MIIINMILRSWKRSLVVFMLLFMLGALSACHVGTSAPRADKQAPAPPTNSTPQESQNNEIRWSQDTKIRCAEFTVSVCKATQIANQMRVYFLVNRMKIVKRWVEQYVDAPDNGYEEAKEFYESKAAIMQNTAATIQELQECIKTLHEKAVELAKIIEKEMVDNPDLVVGKEPDEILQENSELTESLQIGIENEEKMIKQVKEDLQDMPVPPVDPDTNKPDFDEVKFTAVLGDWLARVSKEVNDRLAADTVLQKAVDDAQAKLDELRKKSAELGKQ